MTGKEPAVTLSSTWGERGIGEMTGPTQKNLPLVSVIVPVFNNGRFIGPALESLFRQTYPEERREIIVVDDGSTDDTPEILKKYGQHIFHIRQEHRGVAGARNAGISCARGELITFLDSDDLWYEERLQRVVGKFLENPAAGMVYHPVELINSEGGTIKKNFYSAFGYKEGISGWVANEVASGKIFSGGSSFSFRKDIVAMVSPSPEDVRRGEDYYMTVISSCYGPVGYIPHILGKYRLHDGNLTMSEGLDDRITLAAKNKDFAHMRQKVIEKISSLGAPHANNLDLNILRRLQAKEMIFFHVLTGERARAIKQIPALFTGSLSLRELLRSVAVSVMALFVPAFLYPILVQTPRLLRGLRILTV
jgi:glycosyltransferase involved in cell wall biosynthesis